MSLYGYHRDTTPFLRRITDRASVFTNAMTTASWTYPAISSMLSGLYPHNHGGVYIEEPRNFDKGMMPQRVRDNVLFLSEILHYCGFKTYFASSIAFAEFAVQGRFQHMWAQDLVPAEVIIHRYIRWLRKHRDAQTFAHLHLSDTHEPLRIAEPHRSVFGRVEELPDLAWWGQYRDSAPDDGEFARFCTNRIKFYDAAIRYVDAQIESLFRALSSLSVLNRTLIVVTADHGEELWDHVDLERKHFFDPRPWYGISHGHHLFQEVISVPLLVVGPDIPVGFYKCLVSIVDIVPTLLDWVGIGQHKLATQLDGQNLFSTARGRAVLAEATAYGYEKKVVIQDNLKLYVSKGDSVSWVFDLSQDPKETRPLDLPEVAARLRAYLPDDAPIPDTITEMDAEVIERLRALGYME